MKFYNVIVTEDTEWEPLEVNIIVATQNETSIVKDFAQKISELKKKFDESLDDDDEEIDFIGIDKEEYAKYFWSDRIWMIAYALVENVKEFESIEIVEMEDVEVLAEPN